MSQSHGIKGGATDEAFQDQCSVWDRGASAGADFWLHNYQDILHEQEHLYHTERKETSKKSIFSFFFNVVLRTETPSLIFVNDFKVFVLFWFVFFL